MKLNKKITSIGLAAVFILLAFGLQAARPAKATKSYRPLIAQLQKKVQQQKLKISRQTQLLKFTLSPAQPKAGEAVTVFIQPLTGVSDSETLLTATFDGQDVTAQLEQPAQELWVFDAGMFSELRTYELKTQILLRDKHTAQIIIDAIRTLDAEILSLNNQIDNEVDPGIIADLIIQRDDKISQKNELVLVLADLNTQIGEETFHFKIQANSELSGYPVVTSIQPNVMKSNMAVRVAIQGSNFGENPIVRIDGEVANAWVHEGEIHLDTPLLSDGAHSIEIRNIDQSEIKNTFLENAIWTTSGDLANPATPPTAIATATNEVVSWGNQIEVTAVNSFDANGKPLQYLWRFVSVPDGAELPAGGMPISLNQVYNYSPTAPGLYVLRLDVNQTVAPFLSGSPALVVVKVQEPANSAPVLFADAINVMTNATATRQLLNHDPEPWQRHSYHVTTQGTLGTATVNGNGLISYTAGNTAGTDTLKITAVDNGSSNLSHTITLTVNISDTNAAPVVGPLSIVTLSAKIPVTVSISLLGANDPDGYIDEIRFDFGDGTHEYAGYYAQANHNYTAYGTYNGTVTVKDNFGVSTSQNFTVTVTNTDQPIVKMSLDKTSCSSPCTVTVDASATSDSDGISEYRWRWADMAETLGTDTNTRTITNAGVYWVRLRARDSNGVQGEGYAYVFVDAAAPPSGSPPFADFRVGPNRENTVATSVDFNGLASFDPNPSGSVTTYNWNFGCFTPNCVVNNGGSNPQFQYTEARNFYPSLSIQTVTGGEAMANSGLWTEVINVNTGHAPRSFIWANNIHSADYISGEAPFAVNFDGSGSYDYDGTITRYHWDLGENTYRNGVRQRHIYNTPGVYFGYLQTTDDDGNQNYMGMMIEVLEPSIKKAKKAKGIRKLSEVEVKNRKQMISACSAKNSMACFELAQLFKKENNSFVADQLLKRAKVLNQKQISRAKNK